MRVSALIFAIIILFSANTFAQNEPIFKQTIRGVVIDEDTQSPIIGANVIVADSDPILGITTDFDGQFRIENVPVGRQTLILSYLGYEDKVLPNLLIGSGKELVLEITMQERILQMETVTVTAGTGKKADALNEMALVSSRSFSVEETKRFAAGIGDPARMMTAYAGITSNGGDDQNGIIIRGNSPRGLLWRLEGVEIPNPNHFASEGASSGAVSILSSNTLSKSDFYTGAFPAEFGNALSGAFDIKLRNGNNEKREYALQASFLGLEAAIEGPFKKESRASYLFNYRYSTLGLFTKLGINIVGDDEVTTYQDASFKVNIPTEKAGTFSLYGIGGLSSDEFAPSGDSENYITKSDVGIAGLNHLLRLNDKSFLKSFVAYSGTQIIEDYSYSNAEYKYESTEKKAKTYLRIGTKLRTKLNARHILETGLTYSRLAYDFNEKEEEEFGNTPPEINETFNQTGNSGTLQAYGSWKYRISEDLSWINGVHFLQFGLNKNAVIEPRSALKWQFAPKQSIGFGFGMHSRIESLEYYLANSVGENGLTTQPNKDLDFTKARHYVLSYDNVLSQNWYLKVEAYFQQLHNVPVHHNESNIFSSLLLEDGYITDSLVNKGSGTNYGLELTLQRFFNNHFYMLFSASLYEAKYKAADGKLHNTPFNSNFGLNFLAGKEFVIGESGQNLLGLNLRAAWSGNKRYIPVDLNASQQSDAEILDYKNAYNERLPDYWKIDFQISYRLNKPNLMHEFRIELLNLTNRKNIQSTYYNNNTGRNEFDYQTGIIPALGYRIEF